MLFNYFRVYAIIASVSLLSQKLNYFFTRVFFLQIRYSLSLEQTPFISVIQFSFVLLLALILIDLHKECVITPLVTNCPPSRLDCLYPLFRDYLVAFSKKVVAKWKYKGIQSQTGIFYC
jgi:hypothetical protein